MSVVNTKRSFVAPAPKRREKRSKAAAYLALVFSAVYIYQLLPLEYIFKIAALVSSVIGIAAYNLLFFAPKCADRLLGIESQNKTSKALKIVVYIAQAIITLFAILISAAFLSLAPIALTVFTDIEGAEVWRDFLLFSALGVCFGSAIFVCAIYAFQKPLEQDLIREKK
ncbi:MAG: hypothetical protein LBQ52_04080 [Helicobacteraceae bacterium]|nr:hypothetical protein [Helicobacteraceae bacterium]